MARFQVGQVSVWLAVVSLLSTLSLRAGEPTPEGVLKKHGLRQAGSLYVLETETDVQKKATEVKRLAAQLKLALLRQAGTASAQDREDAIRNLSAEVNEYRSSINLANQQMNAIPRMTGRGYRGGYGNNLTNEAIAELLAYRSQLQMELSQASALLNQLRNQPFDAESRKRVDADVRDRRDSLNQAVGDLRKLIDTAEEKQAELKKNTEVQKALDALAKRAATKPKLGPSPQFLATVKLLERLEKENGDGAVASAPEKATRHPRKSARSRRSTRASRDSGLEADSPF
jgi:hypothetical protein